MSHHRRRITVSERVHVARSPHDVFDYSQDYGRRAEWDPSVTDAQVVCESPRRIRIAVRGLGRFTVSYQLFRRGQRTSAALVDVASPWISGGGGSWRYEPRDGGTDWTQTNTLELKRPWLVLIAPLMQASLRSTMRRSMAEAKRQLEAATHPHATPDAASGSAAR